ncbi:hypothetical protein ACFLSQ_09210, partial [Bacteroidota bacterium]
KLQLFLSNPNSVIAQNFIEQFGIIEIKKFVLENRSELLIHQDYNNIFPDINQLINEERKIIEIELENIRNKIKIKPLEIPFQFTTLSKFTKDKILLLHKTLSRHDKIRCTDNKFINIWYGEGSPLEWFGENYELIIILDALMQREYIRIPRSPKTGKETFNEALESGKQFLNKKGKKFRSVKTAKSAALSNPKHDEVLSLLIGLD